MQLRPLLVLLLSLTLLMLLLLNLLMLMLMLRRRRREIPQRGCVLLGLLRPFRRLPCMLFGWLPLPCMLPLLFCCALSACQGPEYMRRRRAFLLLPGHRQRLALGRLLLLRLLVCLPRRGKKQRWPSRQCAGLPLHPTLGAIARLLLFVRQAHLGEGAGRGALRTADGASRAQCRRQLSSAKGHHAAAHLEHARVELQSGEAGAHLRWLRLMASGTCFSRHADLRPL